MYRPSSVTPLIILACFANQVIALDYNLALNTGMEYSNNSRQTSGDHLSDVERTLGFDLGLLSEGIRHGAELQYTVQRRDFLQDNQEDETVLTGSTSVKASLLPSRLAWFLNHNISEQRRNNSEVDISDNRDQRSTVNTGFELTGRLSQVDIIQLIPSYSNTSFKDTDQSDSDRLNFNLLWQHSLSEISQFTLNGVFSQAEFDIESNDYDYQAINFSYATQLSRLNYSASFGYNSIKRSQQEDADGLTFSINATYNEESSSWGGSLISELTDSTVGLSAYELSFADFEATDSNFSQVDIVQRTELQGFYRKTLSTSTTLSVDARVNDESYEVEPNDQTQYQGSIALNQQLNPRLSITPLASYTHTDFRNTLVERTHREHMLELSLNYKITPKLSTQARLYSQQRDSSLSDSGGFEDYGVFVGLSYDLDR